MLILYYITLYHAIEIKMELNKKKEHLWEVPNFKKKKKKKKHPFTVAFPLFLPKK